MQSNTENTIKQSTINRRFDLIVWDWDGTLANSTGMITEAFVSAAAQVGLPKVPAENVTNIIGLGLKESIHAVYGDIAPDIAQKLAQQYSANYYAGEQAIPLFDGAKETIIELHRRGYKVTVATGKGRRGLNLALQHCGLTQYFNATRTVDECFSKPHPQMLDELMEEFVATPERTLMIGDTGYDMQMAANAGVPAVAVTFGAHSREKLLSYNCIQMFNRFDDLSAWLLTNA